MDAASSRVAVSRPTRWRGEGLLRALPPVLVAEAIDLASIALRRPAFLLVDESGGRHAELLGELRTRGETLGCLLVECGGDGGRAAALGECADLDDVLVGAEAHAHPIARLEQLGGFDAFAVDLDLAGGDGICGQRAGLEEAGGPEPLVDADSALLVGFGGL